MRFCKAQGLRFTRSRPYCKNDYPHVEQKHRPFVREIVGYERYDTPEAGRWLNDIYAILDPYVNFFLPMRKVIAKQREGSKIQQRYAVRPSLRKKRALRSRPPAVKGCFLASAMRRLRRP